MSGTAFWEKGPEVIVTSVGASAVSQGFGVGSFVLCRRPGSARGTTNAMHLGNIRIRDIPEGEGERNLP